MPQEGWRWALLALTVLAFISPGTAVAGGPPTARVSTRIVFDADRSGEINSEAETIMRAPVSFGPVAEFLGTGTGSDVARRRAVRFFKSRFGLFRPDFEDAAPSDVEVADGVMTAKLDEWVPSLPGLDFRTPSYGIWWSKGLNLYTAEPRNVDDISWRVTFVLDRTKVKGIFPPPSTLTHEGSRTTVSWYFPPGAGEPVHLRLDPAWEVDFVAGVNVGDFRELNAILAIALNLLFIPILYLLLRRSKLRLDLGGGPVLWHQVRWLLLATAFALLLGFSLVARSSFFDSSTFFQWPALARNGVELLSTFAAIGTVAAVYIAGRDSTSARDYSVMVAGAAALLGLLLLVEPGFVAEPHSTWSDDLALAAATTALGLIVYGLLNGLLGIALSWLDPGGGGVEDHFFIRWGAEVLSLASTVVVTAVHVYVFWGAGSDWDMIRQIQFAPINLVFAASILLPLAILPGVFRLLNDPEVSPPVPFLVRRKALWLLVLALYLFFVVPSDGTLLSFFFPVVLLPALAVLIGLGLSRRVRLDRLDSEARTRNAGEGGLPAGAGLLSRHRRELISRALLIERLRRLRKSVRKEPEDGEVGAEGLVAYRDRLAELDLVENYLQTGLIPPGKTPSERDRDLVRLGMPQKPPLAYPALGCGPGDDWRENGRIALSGGAKIAILPLAYFTFVLVRHDLGSVFDPFYGIELIQVMGLVAAEVALWMVAAYAFGCLFSWLPWGNGALKGLLLALPVLVGVALSMRCPLFSGSTDWVLRAFELLFFLSLLGLWMDFRTVRKVGLRWRDLTELYQVGYLRFGLVNLIPLLVAAVGIYQELRSGNPQKAIEDAAKQLPRVGSGGALGQ